MLKVLIAEDDLITADMLSEVVGGAGYQVCGVARTVDDAVAMGKIHDPDIALLDLRLAGGGIGAEIVAQLARGSTMGVLYATGNANQFKLTSDDGQATLSKPYRAADVLRSLELVEEMVTSGHATRPFPAGFVILPRPTSSADNRGLDGAAPPDPGVSRRLRQLAEFGGFALGENDLDKVLAEAVRLCALSLGVPFCNVSRYRAEENDLLVEAGVGWGEGVIGRAVSRADTSTPQGRAFTTVGAVTCDDLSHDVSFLLPAFYAERRIVSTMDVVIRNRGSAPWGVLEIGDTQKRVYREYDIDSVIGFANLLAGAIETYRRAAAARGLLDRVKDMVADRDRLVAAQSGLLDEKVSLAHELQDRVGDNLQLVYTMLNNQISSTDEDGGRAGVVAIARRVMSMAQVYDHLLDSGPRRSVDFSACLATLCQSVEDLENPQHREIVLTCNLQPLILDLETSTALGMIAVELLANSFLHAFPKDVGAITVSLTVDEAGERGELIFADDGVGFVEPAESARRGTFLVRRLMRQIDGTALVRSDHGTTWTLDFPVATAPAAA